MSTLISLLLPLLVSLSLEWQRVDGATETWGQVNKYATTLLVQDVYLNRTDAAADTDAYADALTQDVAFGSEVPGSVGYTITAVHAYDLTEPSSDGGRAQLLSGGLGQQHARVRFQRHEAEPNAHFQLVIYGLEL